MLTIVTINYNGAVDTIALLESFTGKTDVIVVDNASRIDDRSRLTEYIASHSPAVHLILNDRNLGFSGGNNAGIDRARTTGSEWVLLLNNDCVVPPGWEEAVESELKGKRPGVYALPVQEGDRVAYAGHVTWFASTFGHHYDRAAAQADVRDGRGYAIGAAVAIHRDVLKGVGLLDERYFLYFEDAEYSLRVQRAGYPVVLLDVPPVEHAVSASTSRLGSPLILRYHARNALLLNATHGPWWVKISLPFLAFLRILTQIGKLLMAPGHRLQSQAILWGILDYYAKRFGPIPAGYRP